MSDRLQPLETERLAAWVASELDGSRTIFGIPEDLWFVPSSADRFSCGLLGKPLETPIGVAAGPHTQLAPNIISAWLCGARVIELKTVQTLDRIEVSKPCINMQDAGYNIEWSQELTVQQSFGEYLDAWILIHVLHEHLGMSGSSPGLLFDLSVGYDLDGIRRPNMRWFLEHMADAGNELDRSVTEISRYFPRVRSLDLSSRLADSVTLSTLHGCPPNEIGAIAEHLLETWGLHTAVKLNPTLIGYQTVREILIDDLDWTHIEPYGPAFDADIGYEDAIELISRLQDFGSGLGLQFGLKLCNTLPVRNRCPEFDQGEETAYLSGRPLHALAVELARRLTRDTNGEIAISFAGGADAFNTPALIAAGLRPVTTCSDLLRPGGYLRLLQYLEQLDLAMEERNAADLDEFILREAGIEGSVPDAALRNLNQYADGLRSDPGLKAGAYRRDHTKTGRSLGLFNCVHAPCTDACAVNQRVPSYMRHVASGEIESAAEVIARDNPLPSILGRACHHPCEPVCLRTHLDQPLAIREIKRFVTDHASPGPRTGLSTGEDGMTAIVGAGPCGLAAAAELARAGVRVVLFEARLEGGGMVSATIPGYRASPIAVRRDLDAIAALGVKTQFGVRIGRDLTLDSLFGQGFRFIVVAVGAQRGLRLGIEGENTTGVIDGLDFLRSARQAAPVNIGRKIAVVGGGDVAMDCARSARRFSDGEVEILYRRTIDQMPAHPEEIRDLLSEGIGIRELVSPLRTRSVEGRLYALECSVMTLGKPDASGRPRPVAVPEGNIIIPLDTLIVAIGQAAELSVFSGAEVETSPSGYLDVDPETLETSIPNIFAGGDLRDPGPSNIVEACGDGQRIAHEILGRTGRNRGKPENRVSIPYEMSDLLRRRSHRECRVEVPRGPDGDRSSFDEVVTTLDPASAAAEAGRCLDCDFLCSTCEGVCPNRALGTYFLDHSALTTSDRDPAEDRDVSPAPQSTADQNPQIVVMADLCNECGNCAIFCPTTGRPWRDKPRIYFNREEFEAEEDNAFMLLRINGQPGIQGRFAGETRELVLNEDLTTRRIESTLGGAIMFTLLQGLTGSMSHLPIPEAEPGWVVTHS